ncbi:MAG: PEP-CTERM sorting domain-containing protein [Phycisphaerae bacterium]|nr:PEP-CTERM sorting domain-containing protein [Phycisphaerae bacterium]
MKKTYITALSLLATAGAAFAGGGGPEYQVTVDYIPFNVGGARGESPRNITIDVRSVEATQDGPWYGVDLNDDGEIAFIDSYIYLFKASPVRGKVGEMLAFNDDSFENGFGDGSLYGFDSYLSLDLLPGQYVLAISAYSMSEEEARTGINFVSQGPYTLATNPAEDWSFSDHGDYSVRISDSFRGSTILQTDGTIFVVPAPAAIGLVGVAGLAMARRRR